MNAPLPVDSFLEEIAARVDERRFLTVVAPPGAGKTTRVPPALLAAGPLILLQPRRVAARALTRRIAAERGWTVGEEIGWQVRFERRFSARTRLLVATEGVLTARLAADPLLSGFRTVVLDEFHERSLHADLALALVRQAARAREDLRVVVMSATLDAAPLVAFLGCSVIEVPGRVHPVRVDYRPGLAPADAAREVLRDGGGHVLCFLPGAPEIRRVGRALGAAPAPGVDVLPLHGSLEAREQDAALAPSERRKLILATNVAETSLTIDGVTAVIDSGLHKTLRHDAGTGLDRLEVERISADSAEQRAGRAGRTAPGRALRLWDPRESLRPHRDPEVRRVDLTGPFLDVLAWGEHPDGFEWFEAPPAAAAAAALDLLERLGAMAAGRITDLGRALRRFPLHPRLARVLMETGGSDLACAACAILSEGWTARAAAATATRSDLLVRADGLAEAPWAVRRATRQLADIARHGLEGRRAGDDDTALLRGVLAGYPDRVTRRREPGSARLLLASGTGAVLGRESGVRDDAWLVALDVVAGERGPGSEALVRVASAVEPGWLEPTHTRTEHAFDAAAGVVRAFERAFYEALVLAERPVAADPEAAAPLLAEALLARGLGERAEAVRRRLRFAGIALDVEALVRDACHGRTRLPDVDLQAWLPFEAARRLAQAAPETLLVPSGRRVALDYRDDGTVHAAVKLQELFGLADTPLVGPRREPVTFSLLAPNGRPVQTTRDLKSFWDTTYPDVRRELRGRYPKHPWPEDPWSAEPTHRTRKRRPDRS